MKREGKKFPWGKVILFTLLAILVLAAIAYFVLLKSALSPDRPLAVLREVAAKNR